MWIPMWIPICERKSNNDRMRVKMDDKHVMDKVHLIYSNDDENIRSIEWEELKCQRFSNFLVDERLSDLI
ncbi:hypothetical protein RDWZM_004370 [Blomia tropicalis]|uniref:Uncharacterized protein n=1 Tax=Blomia tropicalis TaxID=40697 RepID=A0A9Q0MH06_BLOTA|nr:hypothetical protein RDWZM_004370 [Blomia tropicalis]